MVRTIRACDTCHSRFISFASQKLCTECATSNSYAKVASKCSSSPIRRFVFSNESSSRMSSPESAVARPENPSTGKEELHPSNSPQEAIDLCSPGGKDFENGNAENDNEVKLEILDDGMDDDSDDAGVSEGEDEVNCTQLPNDSDGVDDEEEDESNNTPTNHPVQDQQVESKVANDNVRIEINENCTELHEQTTISGSLQSSQKNDICFICGADLTKIKRRVDHIKRCSKKHGITGRDVKINNDHEEFIDMNHLEQKDAAKPTKNPYSKFAEKDWHGNATKVLQEEANNGGAWSSAATSAQSATTSVGENQGATRQTSLASFVTIPMRNLNNVLMGGARRISKVGEIINQRAETRKASGTPSNSRKRGRFGNSNYSSVRSLRELPIIHMSPNLSLSIVFRRGRVRSTNALLEQILCATVSNMPRGTPHAKESIS